MVSLGRQLCLQLSFVVFDEGAFQDSPNPLCALNVSVQNNHSVVL